MNKNQHTAQQLKAQKFAKALDKLFGKKMCEVREEVKRLIGLAIADGATHQKIYTAIMHECGEVLEVKYSGESFYIGEIKTHYNKELIGNVSIFYSDECVWYTQAEREEISRSEIEAELANEEALYGYELPRPWH